MDPGLAAQLTRRLTGRQRVALDGLLAVALAATSAPVTSRDLHAAGPHSLAFTAVSYLAVGAASLPLPARRRYPRLVLGLVVAADAVLVGLGIRLPVALAAGFAMYSLAAAAPAALRYRVVIAAVAPLVAAAFLAWDGPAAGTTILAAVLLTSGSVLVGWLAGENARARRSYALALAERAADRERERAQRTAAEQRARIARELHDVVAHAMSVIAVRSGVARRVCAAQPREAAEALGLIETISRRSLGELRQIVTVLRQAGEHAAAGELGPAPGLADLGALAGQVGAAGVRVEVCVEGAARALPPTEDLSAYRIAQEALTNVVRHSGADTATLRVRYQPAAVEIECLDPGGQRQHQGGAWPANGGHGIVGMRERVALYGGEFSAGPAGPGFRVVARLPVSGDDR
jgi:signal transduction histidine kinase